MNSWNGLDFLIFLIFFVNTILGISRGAVREIISLMCLSVALIITIKFTVPLAVFFNQSPLISDVVDNKLIENFMIAINAGPLTANLLKELFYSISLLICFVGTFSAGEAVFTFTNFIEVFSFPYAFLNRKLGGVLGCIRGYIITLILLVILTLHVFKSDTNAISNELLSNSYFISLFQSSTQKLDDLIRGQQPDRYKEIYNGSGLYNDTAVYRNITN